MTLKKVHTLSCELWLPEKIDKVWAFATDVQNLTKISPPNLKIKVESLPHNTSELEKYLIHFSLWSVPFASFDWVASLCTFESEGSRRKFIDIQERGPFAFWRHEHIFEEGAQGTWLRDNVEYELPLSPLSEFAKGLVHKELTKMFYFRYEKLKEIFSVH